MYSLSAGVTDRGCWWYSISGEVFSMGVDIRLASLGGVHSMLRDCSARYLRTSSHTTAARNSAANTINATPTASANGSLGIGRGTASPT